MGMEVTMEYLTGKTEKKTLGIQDILAGEYEGKEVTVNGAFTKSETWAMWRLWF